MMKLLSGGGRSIESAGAWRAMRRVTMKDQQYAEAGISIGPIGIRER